MFKYTLYYCVIYISYPGFPQLRDLAILQKHDFSLKETNGLGRLRQTLVYIVILYIIIICLNMRIASSQIEQNRHDWDDRIIPIPKANSSTFKWAQFHFLDASADFAILASKLIAKPSGNGIPYNYDSSISAYGPPKGALWIQVLLRLGSRDDFAGTPGMLL
jgi:hypothetical protein